MSNSYQIRYATEQDVPEILAMIKELASFEHESDKVEATEQTLLNTLSFPKIQNAVHLADFTSGFSRTFLILAPSSFEPSDSVDAQSGKEEEGEEYEVAGMALFFTNYSTWRSAPGIYLEDLYIRPSYRRRGYAKALFTELAKETQRIGGKRLEWACLKWNENALRFYESMGARRMEEWVGLRVDGEGIGRLAGEGR